MGKLANLLWALKVSVQEQTPLREIKHAVFDQFPVPVLPSRSAGNVEISGHKTTIISSRPAQFERPEISRIANVIAHHQQSLPCYGKHTFVAGPNEIQG